MKRALDNAAHGLFSCAIACATLTLFLRLMGMDYPPTWFYGAVTLCYVGLWRPEGESK